MIDNIKFNLKSHEKLTKYSARQANFLLSLKIFHMSNFLFWMDTLPIVIDLLTIVWSKVIESPKVLHSDNNRNSETT